MAKNFSIIPTVRYTAIFEQGDGRPKETSRTSKIWEMRRIPDGNSGKKVYPSNIHQTEEFIYECHLTDVEVAAVNSVQPREILAIDLLIRTYYEDIFGSRIFDYYWFTSGKSGRTRNRWTDMVELGFAADRWPNVEIHESEYR